MGGKTREPGGEAREVRRELDEAGGEQVVRVNALLSRFGHEKLSVLAGREITEQLESAGVAIDREFTDGSLRGSHARLTRIGERSEPEALVFLLRSGRRRGPVGRGSGRLAWSRAGGLLSGAGGGSLARRRPVYDVAPS